MTASVLVDESNARARRGAGGPAEIASGGVLAVGVVMALCLFVYIGVAAVLSATEAFWSPDSSVRFIQVESLLRRGAEGLALTYPGALIDPEGRYFPLGPWFHFVRHGHYYIAYPPYFPALVAPLYRAFGGAGLVLLPLVAGLGSVWVTYRVMARTAPRAAAWGAIALGLATPTLIYSAVFWDHVPTMFLSTVALALMVAACQDASRPQTRTLWLAGVSLGFALWLRNEMYVFIPAAMAAWMCVAGRERIRGALMFAAGLVVPLGTLWTLNRVLSGSWLGWKGGDLAASRLNGVAMAAAGHGVSAWIADKVGNAYYQLISTDYYSSGLRATVLSTLCAVGLVGVAVLMRVAVLRSRERAIGIAAVGGLAIGVSLFALRTDISGLLPASPFLVLACLPGPLARWERFLWLVACFFVAGVILGGTHGGLQWGPRYLLPTLPPLVWLAGAALARARATAPDLWPSLRLAAGALVATSMLIQASGVDQIAQMTALNARDTALLRHAPSEIVVTPLEWTLLAAGPVYFEKTLLLVRTPADFRALVLRLARLRVSRWTYVPLSGPRFSPSAVEGWTATTRWGFSVADDRTSGGTRIVTFVGGGRTH